MKTLLTITLLLTAVIVNGQCVIDKSQQDSVKSSIIEELTDWGFKKVNDSTVMSDTIFTDPFYEANYFIEVSFYLDRLYIVGYSLLNPDVPKDFQYYYRKEIEYIKNFQRGILNDYCDGN